MTTLTLEQRLDLCSRFREDWQIFLFLMYWSLGSVSFFGLPGLVAVMAWWKVDTSNISLLLVGIFSLTTFGLFNYAFIKSIRDVTDPDGSPIFYHQKGE